MSTFESIIPHIDQFTADSERVTSFPDFQIEALGDFTEAWNLRAEYLPWLAFRFAADLWEDSWPEEVKRSVIAKQFELHRLKGTKEGIRRMVDIAGGRLVQTVRFPQRAFASGTITKEQRNAWLARMPQLRVYLGSYRGKANACGFARADGAAKGAFARRAFARFDSGEALYGRKAVLRNPDGTETTLRRSRVEQVRQTKTGREYDRLHIPGKKGPALFAGGFVGEFATFLPKQPRIVTYALDRAYDAISSTLHLDTVAPGLEPIDVRWERIAERVPALPGTQFAGRPVGKFARSDMALWHMFDRLYLHDPAVDAPWVRAHSFAGHARLGMRPYHAHMLVEASSKRVARATYGGHVFAGKSFAISENSDKVKLVYAAIRRSKAARDRILVDTLTLRPRVWGDGVPLDGSVTLGQRVRKRI